MSFSKWLNPGQALSALSSTPAAVRNGLFRAACIAAPLLLFVTFFNPYVLDPTRIGWLMEADWGQHVLGWNAFRREPWSTFNHEYMLGAPIGNTILSTDSNPLFAFIFKLFRDVLPDRFQYIGPWFLFCVCMHFFFAYKLVRPHAPNRWAAFGGAVALSALPALYYRMRHDTLVAQWLILWALHLFLNVEDDRLGDPSKNIARAVFNWFKAGPKMLGYTALLAVTGLIHPYILFMVAAIWGGDVLKRFTAAVRPLERMTLLDTVLRAGFVFVWPIVTLGISGAYTKGMSPGAGGWAYYSAGLDSFFNPVRQDFSAILKAWPQSGGQSFEGYQYLGFGILVLIVSAVVLYITTPEAKASRPFLAKLKPLTLPFIALAAIALTNHVQFYGYTVFRFDTPPALRGVLSILRASGRFLWPIAYCGVLTALVVLFKSRPRVIATILPLALLLQAYDLNGFAAAMRRATSLSASTQTYYLTPSPVWDKLVSESKGIDFYPPNVHFNDKLFYELTWRATSQSKSVNTMYAARQNLIQIATEQEGLTAFKRGHVRNDRLFVFLKQCDAPPELQSRMRMLDGVWIIPPDSAKDIALEKPVWSPINSQVRFGWIDQGACLVDENWSQPDTDGVWSEGPKAGVLIPIRHVQFENPHPKALDLNLRARSRHSDVLVSVTINGRKVSELSLTRKTEKYVIPLPKSVMRGENLNIRFQIEQPDGTAVDVTPASLAPVAAAAAASSMEARRSGRSMAGNAEKVIVKPPVQAIKLMNLEIVEREITPPARPAIRG